MKFPKLNYQMLKSISKSYPCSTITYPRESYLNSKRCEESFQLIAQKAKSMTCSKTK